MDRVLKWPYHSAYGNTDGEWSHRWVTMRNGLGMSKAFDMQRMEQKTICFSSFLLHSLAGCVSDVFWKCWEEQLYFLPVLDRTEMLSKCPQWEGICHPKSVIFRIGLHCYTPSAWPKYQWRAMTGQSWFPLKCVFKLSHIPEGISISLR